jgi:retron-type reverse transcriptase
MRMTLEYIYEPKFSDVSHGFRPGRSSHTALNFYSMQFQHMSWVISMDIKGCFDNIDPHVLVSVIKEVIDDKPFLDLL